MNLKTVTDDDAVAKVTHVAAKCSRQVCSNFLSEQCFSDTHHTALDVCVDGIFMKTAFENSTKFYEFKLIDLFVALALELACPHQPNYCPLVVTRSQNGLIF